MLALLFRAAAIGGCVGVLKAATDFRLVRALVARAGVAAGTGKDDFRGVLLDTEILGTVEGAVGRGGCEVWPGVVMLRKDVLCASRGVCVGVDVDRRKLECFAIGALAYGDGSYADNGLKSRFSSLVE